MKSAGPYEAKTHRPRLLAEVERGETITITKHGRPIAVLSPARAEDAEPDAHAVITESRAAGRRPARSLAGSQSAR